MRVLVCGGRNYADYRAAWSALDYIDAHTPVSLIIEGGANGADYVGRRWAEAACNRCAVERPVATFRADWGAHGKAAGPIRNQRMLDEGKPDVVIAFPGGAGTADMVRRAKAAGVRVLEVAA